MQVLLPKIVRQNKTCLPKGEQFKKSFESHLILSDHLLNQDFCGSFTFHLHNKKLHKTWETTVTDASRRKDLKEKTPYLVYYERQRRLNEEEVALRVG